MESSDLVRIPSSINTEFKRFVRGKYGDDFKKGHYMEEFGKAVLRYIRTEKVVSTHAHAQEMKSLVPNRILKGSDKMHDYLVGNYRYESGKGVVNVLHLKDSIKFVFGGDGRTVDKYIAELKKYDIIRPFGETFQFVPLVEEEHDESMMS